MLEPYKFTSYSNNRRLNLRHYAPTRLGSKFLDTNKKFGTDSAGYVARSDRFLLNTELFKLLIVSHINEKRGVYSVSRFPATRITC